MHVFIAFLIVTSLLSGIYPERDIPVNEVRFIMPPDDGILTNTDYFLPTVLQPIEQHFEMQTAEALEHMRIVIQKYDYSCGSAALATILKYYLAEEFEETHVIHGLLRYGDKEKIIERRAFSLLDMKMFLNTIGYQGAGYLAEIEDLEKLNMPCILPLEIFGYRHFAVFKDILQGHVFLADPYLGNTSYPINQFKKLWSQNVVFIVYPSGEEKLTLLQLKNDDLRYIDEDRILDVMFRDRMLPIETKPIETDPETRQYFNLPSLR